MTKREDVSGRNTRYSKLRFKGHHGDGSANQFPQDSYVSIAIAHGSATFDSSDLVPVGATIYEIQFTQSEAFTGGTTVIVGRVGSTSCIVGIADAVNITTTTTVTIDRETYTWVTPAAVVRVTLGGGPAAGHGIVKVSYTI
jgi:hypothetical protein